MALWWNEFGWNPIWICNPMSRILNRIPI